MFRSRLERFIIKRSLVLSAVLAASALLFMKDGRFSALTALIAGSAVSIFRFGCNALVYGRICKNNAIPGGVFIFISNQLLLLPLLYICYTLGIAPFIGFTAGVLIVPAVVMINSVTEAFGITKNNFE